MHLIGLFIGFNIFHILDPDGRLLLFVGSNLGKCGKYWKTGRSSRQIRQDWRNTAWVDTGRLGSICRVLKIKEHSNL